MSQIRIYDKHRDYKLWASWWEARGLKAVPMELLPEIGLVIVDGKLPVCMGFLGTDHGPAAALVNLAADPASSLKVRGVELDRLIQALLDLAKQAGYTVICAATNVPALQARYERLGFFVTDQNVTHYGRML